MKWPWQKKPVEPTPVSAEVAEAMVKEAIEDGRSHGLGVMGYVTMSGPEALKLMEGLFENEEGGLPDDIREFFTGDHPDDAA